MKQMGSKEQCEFCGADLVDQATFCGHCGRSISLISQQATGIGNLPTMLLADSAELGEQLFLQKAIAEEMIPTQPLLQPDGARIPPLMLTEETLPSSNELQDEAVTENLDSSLFAHPTLISEVPGEVTLLARGNEQAEEDEEEGRRAGLLAAAIPLIESLANLPGQAPLPVIPSIPQISQVPVIPGTLPPLTSAGSAVINGGNAGGIAIPPPSSQQGEIGPHLSGPLHQLHHHHPRSPRRLQLKFPRWHTPFHSLHVPGWLGVTSALIAAVVVVIGSTVGLGATVFAPQLSLSGSSTVVSGGQLHLHGQHFLPNSSVTITLDSGRAVLFADQQAPARPIARQSSQVTSPVLALSVFQTPALKKSISAGANGTFNATIPIDPDWAPGQHTLHASEAVSQRSASLLFTITTATTETTPQSSPTATATATPAPTTTPTPTPGVSPTGTPVPPPPTTTPTPTPTNPPQPVSFAVSSASASVSPSSFQGVCRNPMRFTFSGTLFVPVGTTGGTVTYHWFRSDGATGPTQTVSFAVGQTRQSVPAVTWDLGSVWGTGATFWEAIQVTSPTSIASNHANFSFVCQAPQVTSMRASVAPASYNCSQSSVTFNFSATITLDSNPNGVNITYIWSRSDGGTMASRTVSVPAGQTSVTVTNTWTLFQGVSDGIYWEEVDVSSPNAISSNRASFTVSCTPG